MRGRRLAWLACAAVAGAALAVPVGRGLAPGPPTSDPTRAVEYDIVRDDPAPELAGLTLDGRRFDLTDWRGYAVMIGVWASWCAPCRAELRHLADGSARWSTQGLRVVTLNTRDDADAARSLLADVGATDLPAVVDPDGAIAATWRVHALPQTLLIDRGGRIRLQRLGPVSSAWLDREVPTLLSDPDSSGAPETGSGRPQAVHLARRPVSGVRCWAVCREVWSAVVVASRHRRFRWASPPCAPRI